MSDKLLLVEPDGTLCGQLERFLKTLGYAVTTAKTVGGALAMLRGDPVDLVLMDAQLDEDAATVAFASRRADSALVLMGRAAVVDALVIDIGVEVSPEHVLHKPFSAQVLADTVSMALSERRQRHEAEARRKAQESSALDAQLGELQAALEDLGSLVDDAIEKSAPPEPVRRSSGAVLQPDEVVSAVGPAAVQAIIDDDAHGLLVSNDDDDDGGALLEPPVTEPPQSAAPEPAMFAASTSAPPETGARPSPTTSARPTPTPISLATGTFLDDASLPPPPAESTELLARYALRPLQPTTPHDPRGIYGPVTTPELLYNCFRDLFSGWLILKQELVSKTVLLRSGRPIFATSNVRSETLMAMLQVQGRLTPAQVEAVEIYAKNHGGRHGQAIAALGLMSEDQVKEALRNQVQSRIVDCFSWTGATYGLRYDPDASEGIEPFEINPLVLIFAGIKSRYPLAPLLAHYDKSIKKAPSITPRLADYATMLRGHVDDLRVAQLCDGQRALGEILAVSPLGLVDTLRVLRALEAMSCLVYQDKPATAVETRAAPQSSGPRDIVRTTGSFRQIRPANRSSDPGRATDSVRPSDAGRGRRASTAPRAERRSTSGPAGRPGGRTIRKAGERSAGAGAARRTGEQTGGGIRRTGEHTGGARRSGEHGRVSTGSGRPSRKPSGRSSRRPSGSVQPVEPRRAASRSGGDAHTTFIERLEAAETHYEVLALQPNASRNAVSNAVSTILRKLSGAGLAELPQALHPRAKALVERVSKASEVLGNPHRRRTYDALHLPIAQPTGPDLIAAELNFKRGRICMVNDLKDRARQFFEVAAVQDPHQAIYQVYLAWATFELTNANDRRARSKAIELAKEALKADSSRDDGFVLLGNMQRDHGSHDAAVRAYNRALEINAGNTEARKALMELDGGSEPKKETGRLFGKLFTRR